MACTRPFTCVRCPNILFNTVQDIITHFRTEHGLKPETFSAEKRKRFYDSFKRAENENSISSVTAGNTHLYLYLLKFIDSHK